MYLCEAYKKPVSLDSSVISFFCSLKNHTFSHEFHISLFLFLLSFLPFRLSYHMTRCLFMYRTLLPWPRFLPCVDVEWEFLEVFDSRTSSVLFCCHSSTRLFFFLSCFIPQSQSRERNMNIIEAPLRFARFSYLSTILYPHSEIVEL